MVYGVMQGRLLSSNIDTPARSPLYLVTTHLPGTGVQVLLGSRKCYPDPDPDPGKNLDQTQQVGSTHDNHYLQEHS